MRIVYLHQYFRTPAMPGGTRSYELARRLVARGHTVHVVTADTDAGPGAPPWRVTTGAGVRIHWAAVPYANRMCLRERAAAFSRFARVAGRYAARLPQDLVFATSTPLTIAMPAVRSARANRVPMVLEVRDVWPEVPIALGALRNPLLQAAAYRLEAWAYRQAAHVIALSPAMAASISARHRRPVTTIPNGCDTDLFGGAGPAGRELRAGTPWLAGRPLVLYAGTLGTANGVGYLVDVAAAAARTHPGVRFAIIGDGREAAAVRARAAAAGVLDRSLFILGEMPKQRVVPWFGAADLAVSTVLDNPALQANSPNKVFDAFAAGCPVAVNQEGWLSDLIRERHAGLVLPASDPATAAAQVTAFLDDPGRVRQARLGAASLAGVFHRDALFDTFEEVLVQAAAGTGAVRGER
jgi:glycosyltransferase involved in cell wall biosynthesis